MSCSQEHYFFNQHTSFLAKYLIIDPQIIFHILQQMLRLSVDATHMKCCISVTNTPQLMQFQTCTIKIMKQAPNFSLKKWKHNESEEYCWVITQAVEQLHCSRWGSNMFEFWFLLDSCIYIYIGGAKKCIYILRDVIYVLLFKVELNYGSNL